MKFLLDFFPVLGFFIIYQVYDDIYMATYVLMAACVVQTLGHYFISKRFERMHVITLILALLFGGLTVFLRDDAFIKWKVSIFLWGVALFFIFRQLIQNKIALKDLFEGISGESMGISDTLWKKLNIVWIFTTLATGLLNLWIAYNFEQSVWVNFKFWGLTGIQLVLMIATFFIIFKNMPKEKREALEAQSSKVDDTTEKSLSD